MKSKHNIFAGLAVALSSAVFFIACDKVDNIYPKEGTGTALLDWSLYPDGDSAHYAQNHWPAFTPNTNTQRNVLIEDFTGHQCANCPPTAEAIHLKVLSDPERIFAAGIHSGPLGLNEFQEVHPPEFTQVFYNDDGLDIGALLGGIPNSGFAGNPRIAINRVIQNGQITCTAASLNTMSSSIMSSTLKINIQSSANYFASTRGLFLHTEIEKLDPALESLAQVVYLVEDSLVAAQKMPNSSVEEDYVHRDIMRGCIDGREFGRTLLPTDMINGKYYINYSYHLPDQYDPANMHLLIYVYDKTTWEILQVIKQDIED